MKKVLLIKGVSQYDAMRVYIDEYARALQQDKYETIVLDGNDNNILAFIENVLSNNEIDWIFTCNGIFLESQVFLNLFRVYKTKLCTFFYDHPMHHSLRLANADHNVVVICCDRDHAKYLKKYYPNIGHVDFVPLSGSYLENIVPYEERSIDLLFTGSYSDANVIYSSLKNLPDVFFQVANKMIDIMTQEPGFTMEHTLDMVLNSYGFDRTDQEFNLILTQLCDVDKYMRVFYRDKLIKAIIENDIQIAVHGNGWDGFQSKYKDNLILKEGFGPEALKSLANTRISLNIMPWFRSGFQERIASAMLCGAVALTDSSAYIDENFTDDKNIKLYSLKELDRVPGIIKSLLNNPVKAGEIAKYGYLEAKEKHTWHHRMKDAINIIEEY